MANRTQESLALCDTMIARKTGLFNAYSTKGVTYMIRNEYPEAAACFQHSIMLEPGLDNWAVYYQGMLLGLMRRWPESKASLEQALLDKEMGNYQQSGLIFHTLQPQFFQNVIGEAKPYFDRLIELQTYPGHIAAGFAGEIFSGNRSTQKLMYQTERWWWINDSASPSVAHQYI